MLVAAVLLLATEGLVRLRADALPAPLKWATPDLHRKVEQMDDLAARGGASVVFLGSSVVDGSADPSEMTLPADRPAYNAAVRGGTTAMYSMWGERVVLPSLRPDVVVIGLASNELNPNTASQRSRERDFFGAPAARRLLGNETGLHRAERIVESTSAIFKYRTRIRDTRYLKAFLGLGEAPTVTRTALGDYIAPDGQFLSFLRRPYATGPIFMAEKPKTFVPDESHLADLRGLVAAAKRQTDRIIIVNMPVSADYVTSRADRIRFAKVLENEANRAGARFVNVDIWPRSLFADPVHVNTKGSAKLTSLLEAEVVKDLR